jgi:chromosome segregation ATPase
MSTATADAPVTETLPPVGDAPTPKQKEAFLDIFRGKNANKKDAVVTEKVVTETAKTETTPVAKDVVAKETQMSKVEAKTEPVKEDKSQTDAEKNFAALRQKAEAAEKAHADAMAELAKHKAEMEELRKKPAPEEFIKKLAETEKEKAEYQKRLREADLSRDPEFNARYDTGIRTAMQQMVDIVTQAGIDRKEATAAVSGWNKGQFAEWMDTLGPVEKLEFGAAMQQAVTLYGQKEAELAQADQTWQNLQKQREEAQKQQREQYLSTLQADIEANLKEMSETPLGKDHTEVLTEARALLRRAGGLEGERIQNKDLLGMVGKSLLLAKGFERQEKALAEKAEKIAELEKTLEERDKFIKDLNGSAPGVGSSVSAAKGDAKAAARSILNPVFN